MGKLFSSQGGFIKVHSTSLAEPRPLIQLTNTSINVQLNGLHLEAAQLNSSCMKLPKNVPIRKQVNLKCKNGEFIFVKANGTNCTTNVISTMIAHQFIRKECKAYVLNSKVAESKIDQVPRVQEYVDVFSEELPGLSPTQEVEFVIELVLGITTISIAPYSMAPTELKELKAQLQELLDHGFILPSVSLWGALILFVKKKMS
ncbi:uncharacterized protein [Gossypium hirsutum]|uniref:Uncharacterized protein n=1 Tax=Gossypium hirsutum TaxID=3635 RepID=A0ABM3AYZ3_GOSHI|nr:uncharacterized protein LOC121223090 [Gossypium hirsutum]